MYFNIYDFLITEKNDQTKKGLYTNDESELEDLNADHSCETNIIKIINYSIIILLFIIVIISFYILYTNIGKNSNKITARFS
jgi:hypothetical protein